MQVYYTLAYALVACKTKYIYIYMFFKEAITGQQHIDTAEYKMKTIYKYLFESNWASICWMVQQ
jgi:hypothetical protein